MDALKDLALAQSPEHFQLLLLILNLIYIVFLPYLAFVLGASVLSVRYSRFGRERGDTYRLWLAHDLIDLALYSKSLIVFLGVIPALSLVFVYAQLLQGSPAISVGLMGYGFLAFAAGVALLYSYKFTFRLDRILVDYENLLQKEGEGENLREVYGYSRKNEAAHLRAGKYGLALVAIGAFLTVAAVTVTIDPGNWQQMETVFDLFVSTDVLVKLAQFVSLAFAITGICILFFLAARRNGSGREDAGYRAFVRSLAIRLAAVSLLLQPLLLVLNVVLLPGVALSGLLFGLAGLALLLFFLSAHFVYAYHRESTPGYAAYAFYSIGAALVLLFTSDQVAIGNATRPHSVQLAEVYDKETEDLASRLGVTAVAMTGEDIYNAKCSACHLFDQKKVGPPYNTVIPKYLGKKDQLIAFVLNPVKVDPAYPNMPNQGLRPAEADSIASFLLRKFSPAPAQVASPTGTPAPSQSGGE